MTATAETFVVLDANVIVHDRYLDGAAALVLEQASEIGGLSLVVPEVVVDEVVRHWTEAYAEGVKAAAALRRLGPSVAAPLDALPDVEAAAARFAGDFRAVLSRLGVEVLPYPDVWHEEVARRAIARRKPFDEKGHRGYRDVLVWESLLALARFHGRGRYVLLSQDRSAFMDKGAEAGLAQALREEAREKLGDEAEIVVLPSIRALHDSYVEPARDMLDALRGWMANDPVFGARVEELLREAARVPPSRIRQLGGEQVGFERVQAELAGVGAFLRLAVSDARELGEGRFTVGFTAIADCELRTASGESVERLGALLFDAIYTDVDEVDPFEFAELSSVVLFRPEPDEAAVVDVRG